MTGELRSEINGLYLLKAFEQRRPAETAKSANSQLGKREKKQQEEEKEEKFSPVFLRALLDYITYASRT